MLKLFLKIWSLGDKEKEVLKVCNKEFAKEELWIKNNWLFEYVANNKKKLWFGYWEEFENKYFLILAAQYFNNKCRMSKIYYTVKQSNIRTSLLLFLLN